MGKMAGIVAAGVLALAFASSPAQAFSISFAWGDIPLCTSGTPNVVASPAFELGEVPKGTAKIRFRLRDENVPDYDHGGGTAPYAGGGIVPAGAFSYRSPCPPKGSHLYTWTATALDGNGRTLGSAKASRTYP